MGAKPKRKTKRGGQPGNTNAMRHGFYSRKFQDLEAEDLGQVKGGLQDEIAMLRVSIRRVFDRATELGDEFAEKGPGSELFALSQLLTTLGIATTRLAHMLRAQKFLDGGSDDPLEDLVGKVLDDLKGEEDDCGEQLQCPPQDALHAHRRAGQLASPHCQQTLGIP